MEWLRPAGGTVGLLCLWLWSAGLAQAAAPDDRAIANDHLTTGDVVTYGMGLNANRFSPLRQIDTGTVGRLAPLWSAELDDDRGQEAQPLVHHGVLYVITH
jgi:alcohol dehydrogenase (cytochrome c)